MWLIAEYEASTLFTLKPATATASGGKTLLVPTPYAIKMALLDVACRLEGQPTAEAAWDEWLGTRTIALRPAPEVVVNNTFIKILKPRRGKAEPGSADAGYFQRTITYREYAQLAGPFGIALDVDDRADSERLARWLVNINYLGKRGSFIQAQDVPVLVDELSPEFLIIDGELDQFGLDTVLTQLDDTGDISFQQANVYTNKRVTLGRHRILHHVALPYRLVASSRGYSHYKNTESEV
jgi:hypothetical protein